ncbi:hypothetical protein JCM4814A_17750 [Streptomyces phaeofaciens JCM 4814]|uniref:Secreted protein n=2 Tax=Streptomyces phaeofaciens TaxID=68254 RepID=A0A918LU44_9ACTN|nr:hypothetical protein GCM10010226_28530 [Streptomyces phaeofaciens]
MALRGLAAAAAATALVGAFVMRRWDMQAGRHVADLTRARASDEWRFEERVAELETDLDESRELRVKLEQRLRAKRTELAGLRNEHAALLRRYATAETERATALEGRRLLEIETTTAPPALPPARSAQEQEQETDDFATVEAGTDDDALDETAADEAVDDEAADDEAAGDESLDESAVDEDAAEDADEDEEDAAGTLAEDEPEAPAVFSPQGSKLFLRAQAALVKFDPDAAKGAAPAEEEPVKATSAESAIGSTGSTGISGGDTEAAGEDEAEGKSEAADEHARAAAPHTDSERHDSPTETAAPDASDASDASDETPSNETAPEEPETAPDEVEAARESSVPEISVPEASVSEAPTPVPAPEPSGSAALVPRPAGPVVRPSGHFTVPTAVAVVPAAAPVRRPTAEGGFDFFGTKNADPSDALADVQNEDLADVVGQEALALHKAEAEAEFKPASAEARGVGQVIDLTAHDETEHINLRGLRSAVS